MSLTNNSYFIGDRNVPNILSPDVSSTIDYFIKTYEKEYLRKALGYELFKAFDAGLQLPSPDQRFLDILLGKEFTDNKGMLCKWSGLISVTSASQTVSVDLVTTQDIFFTVGNAGAPAGGSSDYVNLSLAGLNYRVTQRVYGPLEPLLSDNSNSASANIQINSAGGFSWLGGIKFSTGDVYVITPLSNPIDISTSDVVPVPDSPIADYVYYKWANYQSTITTGVGEVKPAAQNALAVSAMEKICRSWNNMVEKTKVLESFLNANAAVYPEFQNHSNSIELEVLLTRLNPFFN